MFEKSEGSLINRRPTGTRKTGTVELCARTEAAEAGAARGTRIDAPPFTHNYCGIM